MVFSVCNLCKLKGITFINTRMTVAKAQRVQPSGPCFGHLLSEDISSFRHFIPRKATRVVRFSSNAVCDSFLECIQNHAPLGLLDIARA